jgi:ferritin-like protein
MAQPPAPACPACGGDLVRLVSSFAHHRSVKDIHESSGSPDRPGPDYYQDPRNIGRWTEKRFQEMGMEMPSEISDMIQAAREGELPESVKDLRPGVKEV